MIHIQTIVRCAARRNSVYGALYAAIAALSLFVTAPVMAVDVSPPAFLQQSGF